MQGVARGASRSHATNGIGIVQSRSLRGVAFCEQNSFCFGLGFIHSDLFPNTLRRISSYARRFWFAAGAYGSRGPHHMIAALSEMLRDSPHGQELGPGIVDAAQSTVLPRERTNMRPFRMGTRTWPSSGGLGIRYFPPCSSPTVCRPPLGFLIVCRPGKRW